MGTTRAAAATLLAAGLAAGCGSRPGQVVHPAPSAMTATRRTRFAIAGPEASAVDFDRIAAFPPPGWQIPRAAAFSPDGRWVTYLESESQSETMVLFAFDLETRRHRVLLRASDVVDPKRKL